MPYLRLGSNTYMGITMERLFKRKVRGRLRGQVGPSGLSALELQFKGQEWTDQFQGC